MGERKMRVRKISSMSIFENDNPNARVVAT